MLPTGGPVVLYSGPPVSPDLAQLVDAVVGRACHTILNMKCRVWFSESCESCQPHGWSSKYRLL